MRRCLDYRTRLENSDRADRDVLSAVIGMSSRLSSLQKALQAIYNLFYSSPLALIPGTPFQIIRIGMTNERRSMRIRACC